MGLFRTTRAAHAEPAYASDESGRGADFAYLSDTDVYLDAACQSLRPQPVLDAMTTYFTEYGACGDRGKYAWGRRVDEAVDATRSRTLAAFGLSARRYTCSFTLNTTMGLNLLLQQLPAGRYARVITSHHEHNSVFLSTMTAARRLGVPRVLADRRADGTVDLDGVDVTDAVVVLSAMDNVTGTLTQNLVPLVADVQRRGGAVIIDAAQAAPHALGALQGLSADAVCFSAHKMYGPSLGVVIAANTLLESLEIVFVGGGQVADVTADGFALAAGLHTRLEPGLQAWAEIIGFGAALDWFVPRREQIEQREARLAGRLYDALGAMPHLRMQNTAASATITALPERVDAHRLAVFLSKAGIMVRSGHFCAHHWLHEQEQLPALVRFSLGAHTTDADIDRAVDIASGLLRGL